MHIRRQLLRTAAIWALLGLFMLVLQPQKLPVVLLIVPFVLLFAALYSLWHLLSALRNRYFLKTAADPTLQRRLGLAVCLSATLLMVLQSLGQLSLRDVVTVVAIVVIGYLYLARSRFELPKR